MPAYEDYEVGDGYQEEEESKEGLIEFHLKLTRAEYERYLREKAASTAMS